MTTVQLARVFLRFHGLLLVGTVVYECVNMRRDYATFVTNALSPQSAAFGSALFWMAVFRTGSYALTAVVLLAKTDWVISLLRGKPDLVDS